MLYCVFNSEGDIVGRFKKKEKAINYLIDRWFDGHENEKVKEMTKEEYLKYTEQLIKGE